MKFRERLEEALKKARDLAKDVSKAITANHGLGERRETVGQKPQDVKLKLQELESLLSYFLASDKSEEPLISSMISGADQVLTVEQGRGEAEKLKEWMNSYEKNDKDLISLASKLGQNVKDENNNDNNSKELSEILAKIKANHNQIDEMIKQADLCINFLKEQKKLDDEEYETRYKLKQQEVDKILLEIDSDLKEQEEWRAEVDNGRYK